MEHLPTQLRKNGFTYTLVLRGKRSMIYRQRYDQNIDYFEVFIIKVLPAKVLFGRSLPEREVFPGDGDFGKTAWSCRTLEKAMVRFNKLEEESL
jgi:hypothetical protein